MEVETVRGPLSGLLAQMLVQVDYFLRQFKICLLDYDFGIGPDVPPQPGTGIYALTKSLG